MAARRWCVRPQPRLCAGRRNYNRLIVSILYASTSGSAVEGSLAQVSALANANDALVNPGVYRYTTRLLNQRVYLPIIFKN